MLGRRVGLGAAAISLLALFSPPVAASDLPQTLTCEFPNGVTRSYDNGAFTEKPASALTIQIQKIDLAGQAAEVRVGAANSAGRLAIARAVGANHFLEVVTEGFWNITTVYELDDTTKRYPAVHSRHFGLVGQPVVAQYTGSCAAAQ